MHPGEGRKCAPMMFDNDRRFDKPMNIHFGGRGVVIPALGVGALALQGVHGPVLLPDALHVPGLDVPLPFVMAAVRSGLFIFGPLAMSVGQVLRLYCSTHKWC
jgi:hypothetical protein